MRVGVFLQRGAHDVLDRAVVAEVDDFGALRLDQPAHDVDRGVVAVSCSSRISLGRDGAATAAEYLDVRGAALACSMSTMYLKYSTWPPW